LPRGFLLDSYFIFIRSIFNNIHLCLFVSFFLLSLFFFFSSIFRTVSNQTILSFILSCVIRSEKLI
jgi:hypothetical protein